MTPITFSIIIPTYNRPEQLANCLKSLTHLNYPKQDFEITDVGVMVNRLTEQKKFLNLYKLIRAKNDDFYNQILQNGWTLKFAKFCIHFGLKLLNVKT